MIIAIHISARPGEALRSVPEVELVAGKGITGDRNFGKGKYPGQNVTFIAREAVARYNLDFGQSIAPESTRRNIVTEGVDLNSLVGREFSIGPVVLRGVELCLPCSRLGKLLENDSISRADVVRAFVTSGGLRADIISGGTLAVGMPFRLG
ncbi:MAG: sulfurase [Gammaproteobacteria bacterium]|jgi:MOSC domain-containing protein YiiM|nr:sulfurase [Gammaproteobacteria bacterium]MDH5172714.1 sulfurase [Gammaproteobacteria bacterium]